MELIILLGCAAAGLAALVAALEAFRHPRGGFLLSLGVLLVSGGIIASVAAGVMAQTLANWPDGCKTPAQVGREVRGTVLVVLVPGVAAGGLALAAWMMKRRTTACSPISNRADAV